MARGGLCDLSRKPCQTAAGKQKCKPERQSRARTPREPCSRPFIPVIFPGQRHFFAQFEFPGWRYEQLCAHASSQVSAHESVMKLISM